MTFNETAKVEVKEEFESKASKAKEKFDACKEKAVTFIKDRGEMILAVAPIVVPALVAIASGVATNSANKQKHCLVKDDRTGEKLMVKHPLTNDEIMDMGDRMEANDLSKGEALRDMGLLKKERSRK